MPILIGKRRSPRFKISEYEFNITKLILDAFDIDSDERPYPLDFSVLLNTSLSEAIKYHKKNGIPLDTFMHIDMLKNNRTMEIERNEYRIDWDNLTVYINNCNTAQEYRFLLSINTVYLNDLLSDRVDFKKER